MQIVCLTFKAKDTGEVRLEPDRSFFSKYDSHIYCKWVKNGGNDEELIAKIFNSNNVPYSADGNVLTLIKTWKTTVGITVACLHKGIETLRRTIVYIGK